MKRMTFLSLISALVLAVLAIPLLFAFTPAGIACCIASLLMAVLTVPDLSRQDERPGPDLDGLLQ
ncbi:hypothetical protein [Deinococcus aquiradiocola]|nr:hypothetical protein [Deinococcus aquiradiocola]